MARKHSCNPYEGGEIPPCSAFLGNIEPIIKDGKIIFRNENRVYFFISNIRDPEANREPLSLEATSPISERPFISLNLQISLATYIVGLFINKVQLGLIKYDDKMSIHSDKAANDFIHQMLRKSPEVRTDFFSELAAIISNSNAILPLYTHAINITPLNFYILFLLNRLEGDPGLIYGNNSFATEDPINFTLSALNIWFPTL